MSSSFSRSNLRSGFTLLEVVIAIGVMVLISSLALSTMTGSLRMREALTQQDEMYRSARVGMDRIKKYLRVAFLTDQTQAVGTYRTIFVGKDEGDGDSLWFTHMAHQRKYHGAAEGDQAEVTLWVESGPKDLGQVLMLREHGRVDHEPDKGGYVLPMVPHVKSFNLRYLNGTDNTWAEEWDSDPQNPETPNQLPRAVEIVLEIEVEDNEGEVYEQTFVSTVILELAKPITRSLLGGGGAPSSPLGGMMR